MQGTGLCFGYMSSIIVIDGVLELTNRGASCCYVNTIQIGIGSAGIGWSIVAGRRESTCDVRRMDDPQSYEMVSSQEAIIEAASIVKVFRGCVVALSCARMGRDDRIFWRI